MIEVTRKSAWEKVTCSSKSFSKSNWSSVFYLRRFPSKVIIALIYDAYYYYYYYCYSRNLDIATYKCGGRTGQFGTTST
jgi:hypothetical protein